MTTSIITRRAAALDINVLKGSSSVAVAITNGGGGETAGKIDTTEAALAVAKQVAVEVLGA